MNKHKSNKLKENSNTVRHLIMGQIITTQNLVARDNIRHQEELTNTLECSHQYFNPLRAKFFRVNINMYLHFMSFLQIDMTHVLRIPP